MSAHEIVHKSVDHSNGEPSIMDDDDDDSIVGPRKKIKTETDHKVDDDDRHQNQQQQQQQQQQQEEEDHRSIQPNRLDSEEIDLEEEEIDSDEEGLFQRILVAAAAQGIPLEYLAARGLHLDFGGDDDDTPVDYPFEKPPTSIEDVANFIQSEKCQRIMVLSGAGMSVASGIPDFRSADGLYCTLDATKLTANSEQMEEIECDPSHCLDHHLFMENPLPCLEVNRSFILGVRERNWKATLSHRFVELLRTKTRHNGGGGQEGKLVRLYTQNIDGLEDQCEGIGHQRRIAVHGSMDEAECATCKKSMNFDAFCDKIRSQIKDISGKDKTAPAQSTPIICESCGAGTVKPSIVLFRSRLPEVFFQSVPDDVKNIDLLLIFGTSLAVAPANSIVRRIPKSSMRVLINREPVGRHLGLDYEENDRDFFAAGDCENIALNLIDKLGWIDDLRPLLSRNELPESSSILLRERLQQKERQHQLKSVTS